MSKSVKKPVKFVNKEISLCETPIVESSKVEESNQSLIVQEVTAKLLQALPDMMATHVVPKVVAELTEIFKSQQEKSERAEQSAVAIENEVEIEKLEIEKL